MVLIAVYTMTRIMVNMLAHKGAPDKIYTDAVETLMLRFGIEVDQSDNPLVLVFLTGGSEAEAVNYLDKSKFQFLLAEGKTNSFASALEVKAYSNANGFRNVLLNLDDARDAEQFAKYMDVCTALDRLRDQRLGLIGEVSDWLVASIIDPGLLTEKLGIELVNIPWTDVGDFRELKAEQSFMDCYRGGKHYNIEDAGKVNTLLKQVINDHNLDAITVECFSLVQENDVTACLGLSYLNDLGVPAGCEGDLCSIIGMMILKELTGTIPWMANVASISGNEVLFAHCTAPTSILSEHHINTHFETGKGTAIHGRFNFKAVTIFRLDSSLDKIFHACGNVVDGMYQKHACRTQLHVEFDPEVIRELKENPLGNHHLVLPGNHFEVMGLLERMLF